VNDELSEQDIEKLKNTTIHELAAELESGILHSGMLDENMSVWRFIKYYMGE
jgi:hypothetical protein